ncbi:hypothetical protein [Roseicyclus mahoneyensis]|uniref:Uncharacterized protein n=1 Tax=Roseicyclus mahoneyensis TaxID=164332 RepID=A0A316GKR4_9RHOB|nr:hypothetical protein [Roseicyclus mahoneyensis]PWK61503.1 hypothetical protein C7455_102192 [Roseicyclus mahoneyensis]
MSTPIFDIKRQAARVAACLFFCLALAGCGGVLGAVAPAPAEIAVTSDLIVVTGPEGYCVDPTATRNSDDTGFVLLGNCAAIANSGGAAQPAVPAVLTAAVSEPSDGGRLADSMADLDTFFRSEDGLRLISRTGDASTVTVLDTAVEGDVFLLHASDSSAAAIDGVQGDYWRAYLDVGNRIATLSVLALEDRALSRDDSLVTLREFISAVQAANAGPEPPAAVSVAPDQPAPAAAAPGGRRLFNVGLFRRILG